MNVKVFQLFCCLHYFAAGSILNSIPEDGRLNFTQLAVKYGQRCEEFDVITEDKYILKLFHIEGDKTRPVLLSHGNIDSSDTFILRGNTSLAIALANEGYDLWFLNVRGNKYSRRHETLNPDVDDAFWDFTYHDIGVKDLPANIDFVLKKTNQTKLAFIGHSMGNEISFVLTSVMTEYNDKLKVIIAMAPIAFTYNVPSPPIMMFDPLWPALDLVMMATDVQEMFGGNPTLTKAYQTFCSLKYIGYELCCKVSYRLLMGTDSSEIGQEFFSVVIGQYPTSTSRKNMEHLQQNMDSKRFAQYDYGSAKNLKLYGSLVAPDYALQNISTDVVLFVGSNDQLADVTDAKILESRLCNVEYHQFEGKGHVDFVWGKSMKDFLFPVLFKVLKDYN